jgi:hypothetical protein
MSQVSFLVGIDFRPIMLSAQALLSDNSEENTPVFG